MGARSLPSRPRGSRQVSEPRCRRRSCGRAGLDKIPRSCCGQINAVLISRRRCSLVSHVASPESCASHIGFMRADITLADILCHVKVQAKVKGKPHRHS